MKVKPHIRAELRYGVSVQSRFMRSSCVPGKDFRKITAKNFRQNGSGKNPVQADHESENFSRTV